MVERVVVVRKTRVRFSPSALIKMKNILFVCRFNRTRSRIAAAYFNKINKNENFNAKSAGLFKGSPVGKEDIKLAKKFGIDIRGRVQPISSKILAWQTRTIIVADDVPPQIFDRNVKNGMELTTWKIRDTKYQKNSDNLVKDIIVKVDDLIKQLENEQ